MQSRILWGNLKEEARSENSDGRTTLKRLLKKEDLLTWTGFVRLSIRISDELNVDLYCSNKSSRTLYRLAHR